MAVVDRLKWNAADDVYAWKYPSEELSTWTQLIVSESQEAILIKEGQMVGPFGPGRHTLDTKNYPYLSELFKLPFGKKTPFTAEVWFVKRSLRISFEQLERAPCPRPRPPMLQGSCVVVAAALVELVRRRVQAGHKNRAWSAKAEVAGVGGGGGSKLKVKALISFCF